MWQPQNCIVLRNTCASGFPSDESREAVPCRGRIASGVDVVSKKSLSEDKVEMPRPAYHVLYCITRTIFNKKWLWHISMQFAAIVMGVHFDVPLEIRPGPIVSPLPRGTS